MRIWRVLGGRTAVVLLVALLVGAAGAGAVGSGDVDLACTSACPDEGAEPEPTDDDCAPGCWHCGCCAGAPPGVVVAPPSAARGSLPAPLLAAALLCPASTPGRLIFRPPRTSL